MASEIEQIWTKDEDANIKVWINAEGGSSSSSSTTMIGEMEWSATGRAGASLAEYSASRDVAFAFAGRNQGSRKCRGSHTNKSELSSGHRWKPNSAFMKSMFVVCSNRTVLLSNFSICGYVLLLVVSTTTSGAFGYLHKCYSYEVLYV